MTYEEWSEFIDNTGIYLSDKHKKSLYPLVATKDSYQINKLLSYIRLIQSGMIKKLEDTEL